MRKNVLQAAMFSRVRYYLVTWLPHPGFWTQVLHGLASISKYMGIWGASWSFALWTPTRLHQDTRP
jgi:hypothetical protein